MKHNLHVVVVVFNIYWEGTQKLNEIRTLSANITQAGFRLQENVVKYDPHPFSTFMQEWLHDTCFKL